MKNSLTDLIILFDNKDPNKTVACQEVVDLLEQLNPVYKYAPEILSELKHVTEALKLVNSFGATKPIIERAENLIKKATEL